MRLVQFVLRMPYTVASCVILLCILGVGAALWTPTDIFPEINIPVVSVVWTYNGMTAHDIQDRILVLHERQLASLVDDVSRIEATSYAGVGVIRVYLHEGADVTRAVSQLGSSALVVLKYMPRNITPPLILKYGATDVPIIQLAISSRTLPDTKLNDLGQNTIRPDLAVVHGTDVPYPYGGKPRVIMVDLNERALQARGLSPGDVSDILQKQNVILPSGDVQLGKRDYPVTMNNSPTLIDAIDRFPVRSIKGRTVLLRDVAHVHDGYQVQTNYVSENGSPGALMMVRKTGNASTLAVVNGIRDVLPNVQALMPQGVSIKPLFDQSVFVRAALNSVLMGGALAAGLTALMILLFLGNWRLTLIILASIPLSIVAAMLVMYLTGETLNTMTLGGFALAVGILVDNGTVVIENIERHLGGGQDLEPAIIDGAGEVGVPTVLSTLAICIVFIPVFLLQGTAKYLFAPLSVSVCLALVASLLLSFTVVPVLFKYLMRSYVRKEREKQQHDNELHHSWNLFLLVHRGFEAGFKKFRELYRNAVAWAVSHRLITAGFFIVMLAVSYLLFPTLGMNFFPAVDTGQMRLHVRCPAGTRIQETVTEFAAIESSIRKIVGDKQIDVILDNIGLPYSGINIALSDTATVGTMDGEILISLKKKHTPTATHLANLRRQLPKQFPGNLFFTQPADIVNQVLNFGSPAPIDIRVTGPSETQNYALAQKIMKDLNKVPGVVDTRIFQMPDVPSLEVHLDRQMAEQMGISQRLAASSLLVSLNSSAQVAPNFWLDPRNDVSYPLVVQTPTYRITSIQQLQTLPLATAADSRGELMMNVANFRRGTQALAISQLNIRPVFDINASVQGVDLKSAAAGIEKVLNEDKPPKGQKITVSLVGQTQIMRQSFSGMFSGMGLAVVLVFLLLVINFQSWLDPIIVLMAVPCAIGGVIWMLLLTGTPISVPALMGTLMCIGLSTANSILVVTFANQRLAAGDEPAAAAVAAGYTRLRPVLMTAGAMVLGMIPMALGVGEGGEQNAPLARAVIGGILFATVATLIFVPTLFGLLRHRRIAP